MDTPQREPLVEGSFEEAFAGSILGADSTMGGDVSSTNEEDHYIADYYAATEKGFPKSFSNPWAVATRALAQKNLENTPEGKEIMRNLIESQKLLDLPDEAIRLSGDFEEGRRIYIRNIMESVKLMIQRAYALATGGKPPSYEELYASVTGDHPELVPHKEKVEALRAALAVAGFEGQDTTTLIRQWEKKDKIPVSEFGTEATRVSTDLLAMTREHLLSKLNFPIDGDPHLDGFAFDGVKFKLVTDVHYTGSSVYRGGLTPEGKPALVGINTYNTDHGVNKWDLPPLYAHEVFPGHYLRAAIDDIIRRLAKPNEFERTIGTMNTSSVAMEEGWAQLALAMLYGGTRQNVVDIMGPDMAVHFAMEDLQDAAKHNVSILHQLHGKSPDDIARYVQDDMMLSPDIANKLGRRWSTHPINGPMYGPAYEKGRVAMERAIAKHGPLAVAHVALQADAPMELLGFRAKMGV